MPELRRLRRRARDPNRVLSAEVRPPVEPAVARLDREAFVLEQGAPLVRVEPGELHRRPGLGTPDGERQRARLLVPVGALVDLRLALEPAPVRLLDVLA